MRKRKVKQDNKITLPVGRPPIYSAEVIKKTKEYILSCIDIEKEVMNADKLTTKLDVNLPTIEGLAVCLGIARDTIYEWCTKYKDFSDIIEVLRSEQSKRLLNKGLSGDYNSTIAKLMLMKHGYRDKLDVSQEVTVLPTPIMPIKPNAILSNDSNNEDSEPIEEN